MPKVKKISPLDDLRERNNPNILNLKRTRDERHATHMAKLRNVRVGDVTEITEDLGDAFGNIYYITNEGDTVVVSGGDVIGDSVPSVENNFATFSDTSGKHIQDSGYNADDFKSINMGLYYLSNTASDIGGYKSLVQAFNTVVDGSILVACTASAGYQLIEEFAAPILNSNIFLGGFARAAFVIQTSVSNLFGIKAELFLRDIGGTEYSIAVQTVNSQITIPDDFANMVVEFQDVLEDYPGLEDYRLVLKISVDVSTNCNVTIYYGGLNQSYLRIPYAPPEIDGSGDMLKSVYDPQTIEGDAFDTDNHTDGVTNGVYTLDERSKLAGIEAGAQVNEVTQAELDAVSAAIPTTEIIQDLIGAMFSGNSETGIDATYDDMNGKIDLNVTGGTGLTHAQVMARVSIGF